MNDRDYQQRDDSSYDEGPSRQRKQQPEQEEQGYVPPSWKRSEGMAHDKEENNNTLQRKDPAGFQTNDYEKKSSETRPMEMLNMESSFSRVSIATNRKKETTISVSENRRHNQPTVGNDRKQVNAQGRRSGVDKMGLFFTNAHDPHNSALSFTANRELPERKVITRLKKYSDEKNNTTLTQAMPFLTLDKDHERLRKLTAAGVNARLSGENPASIEKYKQSLAQDIAAKKEQRRRFMRKLRVSNIRSKWLTDALDEKEAALQLLQSQQADTADDEPEDDDAENKSSSLRKKGRPKDNSSGTPDLSQGKEK